METVKFTVGTIFIERLQNQSQYTEYAEQAEGSLNIAVSDTLLPLHPAFQCFLQAGVTHAPTHQILLRCLSRSLLCP